MPQDMTEASAAQLLAALVNNERLWTPSPVDLEARESLTAEAVRAYEATGPVFAAADSGADEQFAQAIWVIRDIADRCAVLSKEWTAKDLRKWVNLPDRASVVDSIRSTGLDRWAGELGFPLALRTTSAEPLAQGKVNRHWKVKTTRRRIADEFVAIESTYRQILEIRRAEGPDWFKEHTSAMKTSTAYIAGARNDVLWAATMEDGGALVVAEALLLVGQGVFVATHAPGDPAEIFPTSEFLYQFVHGKGGYQWLSEHRKDVPEWLALS